MQPIPTLVNYEGLVYVLVVQVRYVAYDLRVEVGAVRNGHLHKRPLRKPQRQIPHDRAHGGSRA